MNRLPLVGVSAILLGAVAVGLINADQDRTLQSALVLADTKVPGCDAPGQLWLELYNVADRAIVSVDGILSLADSPGGEPVPFGNFHLDLPVLPYLHRGACVAIDEARLAGRNRTEASVLARASAIVFSDRTGNPFDPLAQGISAPN